MSKKPKESLNKMGLSCEQGTVSHYKVSVLESVSYARPAWPLQTTWIWWAASHVISQAIISFQQMPWDYWMPITMLHIDSGVERFSLPFDVANTEFCKPESINRHAPHSSSWWQDRKWPTHKQGNKGLKEQSPVTSFKAPESLVPTLSPDFRVIWIKIFSSKLVQVQVLFVAYET